MMWDFALVGTAALVGLLVGVTGVGAGAAMTPLLAGVFGVPLPTAIATDLIFATITKTFGVAAHRSARSVDWKLARRLWLGSIPSVALGSTLLVKVVDSGDTQWITWLLIIFVGYTSFSLVKKAIAKNSQGAGATTTTAQLWLAPVGGAGLGLGVSLTSVGAGALGMALLSRLSPENTSPRRLVATDLLHAIPVALIAGITYAVSGLLDPVLLINLLSGSVPGVILGAVASGKIPTRAFNLILGVVLAILSLALLVDSLTYA